MAGIIALIYLFLRKQKLILVLILFFEIFSFNALSFQISDTAEIKPLDSIIFHEFDGSLYRGSSYNYIARENDDGVLYLGNENGLWNLMELIGNYTKSQILLLLII